jgi:hypothetical protein
MSKIEPIDLECCPDTTEYKNYPYGTSLEFEGDLAEALNVDGHSAGDRVEIRAVAFVRGKSERSEGEGDVEKELRLQLTDITLAKVSGDRVNILYSD